MPISRLFNTTEDALEAVSDLRQARIADESIQVVTQGATYVGVDALVKRGVLRANAAGYAAAVRAGQTLVLVDVVLGRGVVATEVLQRPRRGDHAKPSTRYEGGTWDESAPFSSALHLPLITDNPAALSSFFGLTAISKNQRAKSRSFGLPTLTKRGAPLFGVKTLAKNAAPFSSLFHLPLLMG